MTVTALPAAPAPEVRAVTHNGRTVLTVNGTEVAPLDPDAVKRLALDLFNAPTTREARLYTFPNRNAH